MLGSFITKNSNWKILTKNLVTSKLLKDKMVWRMKNFNILVVHVKIRVLRGRGGGGGSQKNNIYGVIAYKSGRGWTVFSKSFSLECKPCLNMVKGVRI